MSIKLKDDIYKMKDDIKPKNLRHEADNFTILNEQGKE